MYRPPHFAVDDLPTQQALIRAHPLGLLVVAGPGGLTADPIPFLLDAGEGPFGRLRCHVARANPVWRTIGAGAEVLVVFQAAEGYVTPGWYETKRETGKVVPTWNYALVQVHGRARAIEDTDWIATQIADLTALQEAARPEPWAVDDAPAPFIAAQMRGIVGIEIPIGRIEGKWKVSQNRPEADRSGVAEGFAAQGAAGAAMAGLVRDFGRERG